MEIRFSCCCDSWTQKVKAFATRIAFVFNANWFCCWKLQDASTLSKGESFRSKHRTKRSKKDSHKISTSGQFLPITNCSPCMRDRRKLLPQLDSHDIIQANGNRPCVWQPPSAQKNFLCIQLGHLPLGPQLNSRFGTRMSSFWRSVVEGKHSPWEWDMHVNFSTYLCQHSSPELSWPVIQPRKDWLSAERVSNSASLETYSRHRGIHFRWLCRSNVKTKASLPVMNTCIHQVSGVL